MKQFIDAWDKSISEMVQPSSVDVSSFVIKDELEPNVWGEAELLRPEIRQRLLEIASDFWKNADFRAMAVADITFTGSLANYNWSQHSDVDLHILVDFNDLPGDEEVLEKLMTAKRIIWNQKHNIEIFGYEVEIYIQDSNAPHHSTGVYSVLLNAWITKPEKKKFTIDYDNVKIKAAHIMNQVEKIYSTFQEGKYNEAMQDVDRLKEKIRKFRKCGLEHGGEYSSENLAFKALRRNGYLKKLTDIKTTSYDKLRSI